MNSDEYEARIESIEQAHAAQVEAMLKSLEALMKVIREQHVILCNGTLHDPILQPDFEDITERVSVTICQTNQLFGTQYAALDYRVDLAS